MSAKVTVKMAPAKLSGDAIELSPLEGKLIAILCQSRDDRKTRYGQRKMTHAAIVAEGTKEPLEGILFQSYFQELEIGAWYIGKVARIDAGLNRAWVLVTEGLDKKAVAALAKTLDGIKLGTDSPDLLA